MVSLRKMNEHDLLSWWMFHIELLVNSRLWPGPRRRMRWLQQRKQLLQATGPRPRSHLGWASFATRARGPDLKHFTCAQRVFNPTVPSMVQIGTPTKRLLNPLYSEGWLWRSMVTWSDMRVSDHGITRLYQCSPNFSMEQVFCIEFGRWFSKLGYGQLWTIWSSTWSSGGVCYRFLILLMGMPRTLTDGCVKTSTNFGGANAQVGWIS